MNPILKAARSLLAVSGFLTFLSAVAGGFLAVWIAGRHEAWHAVAGSLVVGILIGCWLRTGPSMRPSAAARA